MAAYLKVTFWLVLLSFSCAAIAQTGLRDPAFLSLVQPAPVVDPSLPTSEPSLLMWFAGWKTTGTNTGDAVTSLTDWSGHNYHAPNNTPAPIFTNNAFGSGLHGYRFSGAETWALSNVFSTVTEADVFIVLKCDADPPVSTIGLWAIGSTAGDQAYPFTDGVIYEDFGTDARKTTANPSPSLEALHVYNVTAADAWTNRVNGTALHGVTGNTVVFTAPQFIGGDASGYFSGYMAEFILCSNKLAFANRSNIMFYITNKYVMGGVTIE